MYIERTDIRLMTDREYTDTERFFPEISERIRNFLPEDRKRTLAGRFLLKKMVKEIYGRENFSVFYGENGKPQLDFCFFSISHSGDYVVCAVSDRPVGADIELSARFKRREKYPLFSERESRYVNAEDSAFRFCLLWTRKEAYVKASGGILASASGAELVTAELALKKNFGGFAFNSEHFGGYVLSTAESENIL